LIQGKLLLLVEKAMVVKRAFAVINSPMGLSLNIHGHVPFWVLKNAITGVAWSLILDPTCLLMSQSVLTCARVLWDDHIFFHQADLRLADLRARRRAMEDLHVSLQIVKNVHSALVSTLQLRANEEVTNAGRPTILGSVEEGNSNLRWIRQTVSNPTSDYLTVIEDAYWSMASALVEVEGKDCSDPDEVFSS
jgi:hypothetical protein